MFFSHNDTTTNSVGNHEPPPKQTVTFRMRSWSAAATNDQQVAVAPIRSLRRVTFNNTDVDTEKKSSEDVVSNVTPTCSCIDVKCVQIIPVPGDGNCLFYSLSYLLTSTPEVANVQSPELQTLLLQNPCSIHYYRYIRHRLADFYDRINATNNECVDTLSSGVLNNIRLALQQEDSHYAKTMRCNFTWGGFVDILALAYLHNIVIRIFQPIYTAVGKNQYDKISLLDTVNPCDTDVNTVTVNLLFDIRAQHYMPLLLP